MSNSAYSISQQPSYKSKKLKKGTSKITHFLSQTYRMVMAESHRGVVRWGSTEDTFLIEDPQKFIKVLPVYFKTKNFASFVRQLNMYGFHKVKNDRGVHEFKHPQFKKGHYEELVHIKRKNIMVEKDEEQQDNELDAEEFIQLKEKLDTTRVSLETVTHQNLNLITANKEVASQLYNFKQEYESRLSKFFFMFYFILNSKSDSILTLLKKTLMDLGISYHEDMTKSIEQRTIEASEYISSQVLINSNCDHTIMNKLLNAFTFYVNVGGHGIEDISYPEELLNKTESRVGSEGADYDFRPYGHTFLSSERSHEEPVSSIEGCRNQESIRFSSFNNNGNFNEMEEFSSLNDLSVNQNHSVDLDATIEDESDIFEQM